MPFASVRRATLASSTFQPWLGEEAASRAGDDFRDLAAGDPADDVVVVNAEEERQRAAALQAVLGGDAVQAPGVDGQRLADGAGVDDVAEPGVARVETEDVTDEERSIRSLAPRR